MTQRLPTFEATLSHSKIILKYYKILKANSFIFHYTFSRNKSGDQREGRNFRKIKLQLKILILSLSLHTLSISGSNPNMQNACLHTQTNISSISHQNSYLGLLLLLPGGQAGLHIRRLQVSFPPTISTYTGSFLLTSENISLRLKSFLRIPVRSFEEFTTLSLWELKQNLLSKQVQSARKAVMEQLEGIFLPSSNS